MEVHVTNPELERKLSDLAQTTGRGADDLVQDDLTGYFEELATLRSSLDGRYDDLKSGRVQALSAAEAIARRKAKSDARRDGLA